MESSVSAERSPGFVPRCTTCTYDLSGIPGGVCPECGAAFNVASLRATWLALHAPDSDEALLRGFAPACPECSYDLGGSPDGPCPECGTPFALIGLRTSWIERERRRRQPVSVEFVLAIPTIFSLLVWWAVLYNSHAAPEAWIVAIIAAVFCALWTWICRKQLLVRRPLQLLGVLVLTIPACMLAERGLFWFGVLAPVPWVAGALASWGGCRDRHRMVPAVLAVGWLMPPGIAGLLSGGAGWLRGEYWSAVDSLLPRATPVRVPMNNPAACMAGAALVLAAVLTWWLSRRYITRHPMTPAARTGTP